jgi:alkyl hydroperoxide reductase subunit AhpF
MIHVTFLSMLVAYSGSRTSFSTLGFYSLHLCSNWQWPNIPGIEKFKGTLLHSANWDSSYDWSNKNVAVIGIGSSGVQIVPKVAKSE